LVHPPWRRRNFVKLEALGHGVKDCYGDKSFAFQRTKTMLNSLTYSQNKNGAQQKQNIFCLISEKPKSLIYIGSFFAPSLSKRRKPA
jgi:hypothetical protein